MAFASQAILVNRELRTTFIRRRRKSLMITRRQSLRWVRYFQGLIQINAIQCGVLEQNGGTKFDIAFNVERRSKCIVSRGLSIVIGAFLRLLSR